MRYAVGPRLPVSEDPSARTLSCTLCTYMCYFVPMKRTTIAMSGSVLADAEPLHASLVREDAMDR